MIAPTLKRVDAVMMPNVPVRSRLLLDGARFADDLADALTANEDTANERGSFGSRLCRTEGLLSAALRIRSACSFEIHVEPTWQQSIRESCPTHRVDGGSTQNSSEQAHNEKCRSKCRGCFSYTPSER